MSTSGSTSALCTEVPDLVNAKWAFDVQLISVPLPAKSV